MPFSWEYTSALQSNVDVSQLLSLLSSSPCLSFQLYQNNFINSTNFNNFPNSTQDGLTHIREQSLDHLVRCIPKPPLRPSIEDLCLCTPRSNIRRRAQSQQSIYSKANIPAVTPDEGVRLRFFPVFYVFLGVPCTKFGLPTTIDLQSADLTSNRDQDSDHLA